MAITCVRHSSLCMHVYIQIERERGYPLLLHTCVSPRVKTAEPCTQGSTSAAEEMRRISRNLRPSQRACRCRTASRWLGVVHGWAWGCECVVCPRHHLSCGKPMQPTAQVRTAHGRALQRPSHSFIHPLTRAAKPCPSTCAASRDARPGNLSSNPPESRCVASPTPPPASPWCAPHSRRGPPPDRTVMVCGEVVGT